MAAISCTTFADQSNNDGASASFHCGDPSEAIEISNFEFNTISTQYIHNSWKGGQDDLLPKTTNWHIYAIPDDESPKYSCFPLGFVEPQLSGSTLQLLIKKDRLKDLGYSRGDRIESSINVYVPLKQLKNIRVDGVDQAVEVIVTESLLTDINVSSTSATTSSLFPTIRIRSSGVDTRIYVTAPYSAIDYTGSGVDNEATIQAGRNSTIDLSGVNQQVRIQSEFLVGNIDLSGINNRLYIEGDYEKIRLSGVDCQVQVNGKSGCNSIDNSGVNNNCRVSEENVTVPGLSCLASTKVIQEGPSVGAAVGMGVGLLALLGLCLFGCVYSCRGCGQSKVPTSHISQPPLPDTTPCDPPKVDIVEAEVIGIEPSSVDPELAQSANDKFSS